MLTLERARCRAIGQALSRAGLFEFSSARQKTETPSPLTWRLAASPFWLSAAEAAFFDRLGPQLHAFYHAVNQLYHAGRKGQQPDWICRYFDQGKPESVIDYGRMNRFKSQLPGVIRPDLIPTDGPADRAVPGAVITELDAVPGGIGLTAALARAYAEHGDESWRGRLIGGANGMITGFAAMIQDQRRRIVNTTADQTTRLAIIVSEESSDYRAEMSWLGGQLGAYGVDAATLAPEELHFTESQLEYERDGRARGIDVLYRFFELFDLKNIPKSELLLYGAKKGLAAMTPPPKSYLEEKLAFALFHHPVLRQYWESALPAEAMSMLRLLIPPTWILDPAPLPPQAVIPGLLIDERPVTSWDQLAQASQKGRRYALKPSGFSPLAWGSRGVVIGHDQPQELWAGAVRQALAGYAQTPYVLQPFISGRPYTMSYWDPAQDQLIEMEGRVRLSPYYFVVGDTVQLGGILATLCPMDKKLIHGMTDAILAPCAIHPDANPIG